MAIIRVPIVLFYAPNILCYARILLAFVGLQYAVAGSDVMAAVVWCVAASLDLFDGMLARAWNQTSAVGILLDIVADNMLRACMWMAAVAACANNNSLTSLVATLCICLEWTTMVCTQLLQQQQAEKSQMMDDKKKHWKKLESSQSDDSPPPWLIRAIFVNNFRNPLGAWCIFGLFGSPFLAYVNVGSATLRQWIPQFSILKYLAYVGRGISALAELWFCKTYLGTVVAADMKERQLRFKKDRKTT